MVSHILLKRLGFFQERPRPRRVTSPELHLRLHGVEGHVRGDDHPWMPAQRVVRRQGFDLGDVVGQASDASLLQRARRRLQVHQPTPRGVDDDRAPAHHPQRPLPDKVPVLGRHGRVEGDVVGLRQGLLLGGRALHAGDAPVADEGIVSGDFEAEGSGPVGHPASDPTQPEEGESPSGDPVDVDAGWEGPLPVADDPGGLDDAAGEGEQERHRVVRDLVQAVVGHVGDLDAVAGRGFHVDVVVPDSVPGDDPAAPRRRGLDDGGGHPGVDDHQGLGVARFLRQGRLVRGCREHDLRAERREDRAFDFEVTEEAFGDEDLHGRSRSRPLSRGLPRRRDTW